MGHVLCDIRFESFFDRSSSQMQIRVAADEHIDSNEELTLRIEGVVEGSLDRYLDWVTLVEVRLSRLAQPHGGRDMCCRMEAHLGGLKQPVAVSHEAFTLTEAIHAASAKLERAIHDESRQHKPNAPRPADEETGADETASLEHTRA